MKPLSIAYYYFHNVKRMIPVSLSIALAVLFLYFLFLAGKQAEEFNALTHVNPYEHYSGISSGEEIPQELVNQILETGTVKEILPLKKNPHTAVSAALGNNSAGFYFMRREDITSIMEEMGLTLTEGRMPEDENEILLHWRIAANLNLTTSSIFTDEYEIQDDYQVVGLLDGNSAVGFIPTEITGTTVGEWLDYDLMLIPEQGQLDALNSFLDSLPTSQSLRFETLSMIQEDTKENTRVLNRVMILLLLIIMIVLSITLSETSIMHFYQRRAEFGLLTAVGYNKGFIIRRVWLEAVFSYTVSFLIGIGLSMGFAQSLNVLVWNPMGENVSLWNLGGFLITLTLPVVVTVFSVLPIRRLLRNKDLINIIEGY